MAIATAVHRFNDLGRSVTPTCLSRNIFYLQLSAHCPKLGKLKKFQDFCPREIEFYHLATSRCVKLWSLNSNLLFKEPHQLTIWQRTFHFKDLTAIYFWAYRETLWPCSLTKPNLFRCRVFFGAFYLQNEVGDPPFFCLLAKVDHYLSAWQV